MRKLNIPWRDVVRAHRTGDGIVVQRHLRIPLAFSGRRARVLHDIAGPCTPSAGGAETFGQQGSCGRRGAVMVDEPAQAAFVGIAVPKGDQGVEVRDRPWLLAQVVLALSGEGRRGTQAGEQGGCQIYDAEARYKGLHLEEILGSKLKLASVCDMQRSSSVVEEGFAKTKAKALYVPS